MPNHRLRGADMRNVVLERTSEMLSDLSGSKVVERINVPRAGVWMWKPDADALLASGKAGRSGTGGKIDNPFHIGQAPKSARDSRPSGPPKAK